MYGKEEVYKCGWLKRSITANIVDCSAASHLPALGTFCSFHSGGPLGPMLPVCFGETGLHPGSERRGTELHLHEAA